MIQARVARPTITNPDGTLIAKPIVKRAARHRAKPIAYAGMALVVFAGTAAAPVVVAPPTLTGEVLESPTPQITTQCNPNGVSTVTFSATGVATGPYPGTFTEVGTATIGPQTLSPEGGQSIGSLLTFDAVFTIDSPAGQITGTKTLAIPFTDPATQVSIGQCNTFNVVELEDVIARFTVRYEAQIATPTGTFSDRGVVPAVFVQRARNATEITFQVFHEEFLSDLTATEPLTTPGQATGGGQLPANVTFGLTAKSDASGIKGNCTVIDRATNVTIKCLDAVAYFQSGSHAVFSGNATVNGVATTYRITVDDNAEPGRGADTFTISTGTGYSASGVLSQGNIQVHQ